jgi:hypothetical protein
MREYVVGALFYGYRRSSHASLVELHTTILVEQQSLEMLEHLSLYLGVGKYSASVVLIVFASVFAPFYVPSEVELPQSETSFGEE